MSIVVTCGYDLSGYNLIHENLLKIGLNDALNSKSEEFSPSELLSKMCLAHEASNSQISQVELGKFWQSMASDLFRANLDQKNWGWADSKNIFFLNFWNDFDPQIRFVLVYSSPEIAIAQCLSHETPCRETVEKVLAGWSSYNRELIRFCHSHKDRCVLVNVEAVSKNFHDFKNLLRGWVDVPAEFLDIRDLSLEVIEPQAQLFGKLLVEGSSEHVALYQDLEAIADLPFYSDCDMNEVIFDSWHDYQGGQKQINHLIAVQREGEELEKTILSSAQVKNDELTKENEHLRSQILNLQSDKLQEKCTDAGQESLVIGSSTETKVEELANENELLLLQLHQVQEELELYFTKYQELASGKKPDVVASQVLPSGPESNDAILDLRHFIDGQNWFHAEHDGRWSGPGTTSSLKIPQLKAGQYLLELHVIGAMAPDIIRRMKLIWRGEELTTRTSQPWRGLKAFLRRYYLLVRENREGGPLIIRTKLNVPGSIPENDQKLLFEIPSTISPSSRGQDDTRDLGFKLSHINITPIL